MKELIEKCFNDVPTIKKRRQQGDGQTTARLSFAMHSRVKQDSMTKPQPLVTPGVGSVIRRGKVGYMVRVWFHNGSENAHTLYSECK